jgi:hypothetical protein
MLNFVMEYSRMMILSIAFVFGLTLCGLGFRANEVFRNEQRLPMQWWLNGQVTWSAPRALALAFVPILAVSVLTMYVYFALSIVPRSGQKNLMLPTLIFIGVMFVAIQLLHLWLIRKTLRRNGS